MGSLSRLRGRRGRGAACSWRRRRFHPPGRPLSGSSTGSAPAGRERREPLGRLGRGILSECREGSHLEARPHPALADQLGDAPLLHPDLVLGTGRDAAEKFVAVARTAERLRIVPALLACLYGIWALGTGRIVSALLAGRLRGEEQLAIISRLPVSRQSCALADLRQARRSLPHICLTFAARLRQNTLHIGISLEQLPQKVRFLHASSPPSCPSSASAL